HRRDGVRGRLVISVDRPPAGAADPIEAEPLQRASPWTTPGFRMSWRVLAIVFAALLAFGLLAFAGHILHRGFYFYDWANDPLHHHGRHRRRDALDVAGYRPISALYIPLPWIVLGMHMKLHLAWAVVLAVVCATLLYRVLGELDMTRLQAGAAAA